MTAKLARCRWDKTPPWKYCAEHPCWVCGLGIRREFRGKKCPLRALAPRAEGKVVKVLERGWYEPQTNCFCRVNNPTCREAGCFRVRMVKEG